MTRCRDHDGQDRFHISPAHLEIAAIGYDDKVTDIPAGSGPSESATSGLERSVAGGATLLGRSCRSRQGREHSLLCDCCLTGVSVVARRRGIVAAEGDSWQGACGERMPCGVQRATSAYTDIVRA